MNSINYAIVVLFNKNYIEKAFKTIHDIRTTGNYNDLIVCVGGSDWTQKDIQDKINEDGNIVVESFPDLDYNSLIEYRRKNYSYEYQTAHITRPFQNHKIYLFHPRMKKYNKIFYIDVGMQIYKPLQPFLELNCDNSLIAHSDAYPQDIAKFNLLSQFAYNSDHILYMKLLEEFNNCIRDYFQTTTMIYDTNIIKDNTFDILKNLMFKYPFSRTNDQGIIALWFEPFNENNDNSRKIWKKMNPLMYDYCIRDRSIQYIMTKCN